jgi:Domain of unknown function (DUF4129)
MRGSAARVLVPALVVLGLVGLVAIAAGGSTPSGSGGARPPGDIVLETFLSFGILALVAGAALFVYGLTQRRAIAQELRTHNYRRSRAGPLIFLGGVLFVLGFFALRDPKLPQPTEALDPNFREGQFPQNFVPPETPPPRDLEFAWLPVLVVLSLAALALGAYWLSRRLAAAAEADPDAEMAARLAHALDESLDDLRAESDPRKAVVAAYARLERVLGSQGVPRADSETADEYLSRILERLEVESRSVRDLTDLFTEAKFSSHAVDAAMKERALDALTTVRDELRDRRDAERAALAAPPATPGEAAA